MTLRAVAGILALNAFILVVGAALLWGIRGWRWWTELAQLAGIAYFLGLSALMTVAMLELVVGIPIEPATIVVSGAVLAAAGIVVGRSRGFAAPALRPPGWRFPGISIFAAMFLAGIVVYFEAFLRAARLSGVVANEWDSWANWLPKSRSLYLTGRLDLDFLALVPQPLSYPPGHTTIQAFAFHAMGSADAVTLHLQYWLMAAFFVVGVVGLLAGRVRAAILFPVLLAFLVAPYLLDWVTTVYADIPYGYLVALAALLVILWIEEKETWMLAAATVLLAGAMLTKREGMLFAACVVLAGLVASFAERRQLWPRLLAAGLVAFLLVLPWRIWFTVHGFPGDGPETGYLGAFDYLDRVWPALEISVTMLFHEELWYFASALAVGAILVALLAQAWRVSLFAATFLIAGIAGVTWIVWTNTFLVPVFDDWAIRRFTGTTAIVLGALTPLLLQHAWSSERASGAKAELPGQRFLFGPSRAAWAIVLVGLLSHPVSALVGYSGSGLPGGGLSFPGESCDVAPVDGANVRLVVGYADSYPDAVAMQARAHVAGLDDVQAAQDGCGRLRVYVDDLPSAAAQGLLVEAQAAGLTPTVELDPDE